MGKLKMAQQCALVLAFWALLARSMYNSLIIVSLYMKYCVQFRFLKQKRHRHAVRGCKQEGETASSGTA